ncbi:TPA: hypothetical protein N0F65_007766 [Lagenidium giganteum]|uniref:Uncharacterized protein n=1 Tax=Lagenidium giganteum TaxID=4803 RepID=A0AAV2YN90_9STRA|nr:TPA: hypothetical protein N0F65_007766 [Lagenidium giganteum]
MAPRNGMPKAAAEEVTTAPADGAMGELSSMNAHDKLSKLDTLLEKAGLYSSFLSTNMAAAAAAAPVSVEEVDVEEEAAPTTRGGRRKRPRATKAKQPKEGEKKLKRMQETTAQQQLSGKFTQPQLLTGGTLRTYQLEGVQWLCNLFENGLNGILADEMGLGKTIQVIALIAHLKEQGVRGPFLIVAPLSTLPNWEKEFERFTPDIPAVIYHGTKDARRALRLDVLDKTKKNDMDFPVVITSYEVIMQDRRLFNNAGFVWKYVIIDEGHRLKNMNCRLIRELKQCHSENRLLLTGTPLQNNLTELWSLLNFILPDVFDDLELFESWFSFSPDTSTTPAADDVLSSDKRAEVVSKLHEILRPFLLRRLKVDVVEEMPSKTEIFVYCPMSPLQREFYGLIREGKLQSVMEAKYGAFRAQAFRTNNLRNRAMQLRKCCNHPYLFDEPTDATGQLVTDEQLVQASGKLLVLDKMLTQLKRDDHKVLIFSQMTRILDILEDFLRLRSHSYCRLDGNTEMRVRQEQMEAFNRTGAGRSTTPDEDNIFCFLLSTRAGGLGINLIAADTVIFFDSDWNPQQDNQAQDRCHRIGQTKEIAVYRLVTENSFENRMIARAIEKRKLERVVIQRGHFKQAGATPVVKQLTNEELEELMKDDIDIREGVESGGISDEELARICDRELIVRSFVEHKDASSDERLAQQLLQNTSKGYEVVEASQTAVMESFA